LYNSPCSGFPKTEEDDPNEPTEDDPNEPTEDDPNEPTEVDPNEPTEDDPNEPTEDDRIDIDIWAPYLNKPGVTRGP
jgi:hypothetical protein